MKTIPQVIFNLLAQRKEVVLPQFGTLKVWHIPAVTDLRTGALITPNNRLVFNENTPEGATLLTEHIAHMSGVEVSQVQPVYDKWLADLKKESAEGRYTIEGVCTLTKSKDGVYTVQPDEALEQLLNPIGRSTLEIPYSNEYKKGSGIPTAKKTVASTRQQPKEKRTGSKKRTGLVVILIVTLLLILGGGGLHYYMFMQKTSETPSAPLQKEEHIPVPPPAVVTDTIPGDTAVVSTPAQQEPAIEQPAASAQSQQGPVYHVISGVFSSRENAERHIAEDGLDKSKVEIIPTANGKFMVSAGKFSDKDAADREMERLQEKCPGAWVSKRSK